MSWLRRKQLENEIAEIKQQLQTLSNDTIKALEANLPAFKTLTKEIDEIKKTTKEIIQTNTQIQKRLDKAEKTLEKIENKLKKETKRKAKH